MYKMSESLCQGKKGLREVETFASSLPNITTQWSFFLLFLGWARFQLCGQMGLWDGAELWLPFLKGLGRLVLKSERPCKLGFRLMVTVMFEIWRKRFFLPSTGMQGRQEWGEVGRHNQPFGSRTDFRPPWEQRVHVLHPQGPGHMKSPQSFSWKGVPGGPNDYRLLYFSLSIPIMMIFISTCSHKNSGLCLFVHPLVCVDFCI